MIFNKQKYSILILLFLVVMARCTSPEEYSIIREDILVGSLRGPVTEVSVYELVEGQRELIFTESFDRMKRTSVGRGASAKKSDYERSYYSAEGKSKMIP